MMKKPIKVLFVASECAPIVRIGEQGHVIGSLPKELHSFGFDARIIMPLYKTIDVKKFNLKPIWRERRLKIKKGTYGIGLWSGALPRSKTPVYFIENKKYIGSGSEHFSNKYIVVPKSKKLSARAQNKKEIERFVFFSNVVFELLQNKLLPFEPDILHIHDWHGSHLLSLVNNFIKEKSKRKNKKLRQESSSLKAAKKKIQFPSYFETCMPKTILTIHDISKQGIFNNKNYLKAGIESADAITTVSPTYAEEIKNKENGFGLHVLMRKKKPLGIISGFDYDLLKYFGEKESHKLHFQETNGLKRGNAYPMFAMISDFHDHKGIQWVIPIISYVVELFDAQFVFLGNGKDEFENALLNLSKKYPENVLTNIGFDEELANSIYAASDFILMPSSFEPCGSNQMIALRYGTLPIVRATGGFIDTIEDGKSGFVFEEKNEKALLHTIKRALSVFADEPNLERMRELAIKKDFNWRKSSAQYAKLYREIIV